MIISYKTLFAIEMEHEYFNKGVFNACILTATADTVALFKGNLLQKFSANKLTALIKEGDKDKPFTTPDPNCVFRFYLKITDPYIFNYSNLDTQFANGKIACFSNTADNNFGGIKNLTAPIKPYDAGTLYLVGDFVKHNTPGNENIFECIKKGTGNLLADTASWLPRGQKRFISKADSIRQTTSSYRYSFGTDKIKKLNAEIKGFKASGTTLVNYDVVKIEQVFSNAITEIGLDFSTLTAGRYLVSMDAVTDAGVNIHREETVYYDEASFQPGVMAVVEIFNNLDGANEYALIDNTGKLKQPKYTIQFPAKNTFWKYIADSAVTKVDTISGDFAFTKIIDGGNKIFTSAKPIQFLKQPEGNITLEFTGASPPPLKAPFASPSVIKFQKDLADGNITSFFTEVYLNY